MALTEIKTSWEKILKENIHGVIRQINKLYLNSDLRLINLLLLLIIVTDDAEIG